jgi:hypothetical protein
MTLWQEGVGKVFANTAADIGKSGVILSALLIWSMVVHGAVVRFSKVGTVFDHHRIYIVATIVA